MNPGTGLCSGCYRTLDEIASWSRMADAAKKQVWDQLMVRAQGDAKP